ncbi:hypothetical protein [Halpernia sp. GG3]
MDEDKLLFQLNTIIDNYLEILENENISDIDNQRFLILISNKQILVSKTIIKLIENEHPEINSIFSLMRLLNENYLINYYLHFENIDYQQKCYRYLLYEYCGLHNRSKYTPKNIKKFEEIKNDESIRKDFLQSEIKLNEYFIDEKIKKIPTKIFDKVSYFDKTDLNEESFVTFWRLFSNYAHSEYISLIHFIDIDSDNVKLNHVLNFCEDQIIYLNCKLKINLENNFKKWIGNRINNSLNNDLKKFEEDLLIKINS